ncbi:GNAT family N-acetyltransferase [Chromobacterium sphagni]|uniref:GNAT family N-acetyltransferase n=1 Tax=Chromobacterium sphagni TaxID=1903179 RepID=A0A1S1X2Y9_9NEIS|nr:GNAT family protein [Chromobacterium sphagni]OHX13760.1 GNAT family N-acetyltransferase [Chromobacterium sphagni]
MFADWQQLVQPAEINALGQAVGSPVPDWSGARHPPHKILAGQYCRVEPLDVARHGGQLFDALHQMPGGANWTYLSHGPFPTLESWEDWMGEHIAQGDPQFYAIVDQTDGVAIGLASYLRIAPADGSIEVGFLHFSPRLQRSRLATEAMYLMMREAFALGYRRYEWKCDAQNSPSVKAALRLGFTFEGLFRQARTNKGRNRDTAWFSILDHEWPARRAALESWLDEQNFDGEGRQRCSLAQIVAMRGRNRAADFMPAVGGATMDACNR